MGKEKSDISFLSLSKRIVNTAHSFSAIMVINIIGVVIMAFNSPYSAWAIKYLVDNIVNNVTQGVWKGIFFLVGGYLFFGIINYALNDVPCQITGTKINGDLRKRILDHLFSATYTYVQNKPIGEIMNHLNEHTYTVGSTYYLLIFWTLSIFISIIASISYLFVLVNYRIILIVVPLLICRIILPSILRKRMTYLSEKNTEAEIAIKSLLTETLDALPEIKNFQMKNLIASRYSVLLENWIYTRRSKVRLQVLNDILSFLISNSMEFIVFFVGGIWVLKGELSIGSLLAVTELVGNLYYPFRQVADLWSNLQSSHGDLKQIESVLKQPTEDSVWAKMSDYRAYESCENTITNSYKEGLTVSGLSFSYSDNSTQLKSVSFSANPSQITLIMGPSGAGKSTLLHVLAGLMPEFKGDIRLYGTSYNEMTPEILRTKVCLCEQDSYIFSTSILKNITMVKQDIPEDLLNEVLDVMRLNEVIDAHAGDYQDMEKHNRKALSGGEMQRVALARAIVYDTPVLLFDEPTSAVDEPNTLRIARYFAMHKQNKIIIIATHEPVYIPYADKIVFIENGEVVCTGKHEELLSQNARYKSFCESMEKFVKGDETA